MARVFLVDCDCYDPAKITDGIRRACETLGVPLPSRGRVFLHPACPWAHPQYAPACFTHPEVLRGMAHALTGVSLTLGTNSLPLFPTRYSYRKAGYTTLARQLGARLVSLDQEDHETADANRAAEGHSPLRLPTILKTADFSVTLPKLRGSCYVGLAASLRHLHSLLPPTDQLSEHHRLPEITLELVPLVSFHLIVVDAIQASNRGGEVAGEPIDLGVLIVGTDPVAVDLVCAELYGLRSTEINVLQMVGERGLGPREVAQVDVCGDLDLTELRRRSRAVHRVDPRPENYPLPEHLHVARSGKAPQAGTAGGLAETFFVLERAGLSFKKAREAVLVIGQAADIPKARSDEAAILFLDDTSRAEVKGYGRVIRLQGRNQALSRLLLEVPFALRVANLRAELGGEYLLADLTSSITRRLRRSSTSPERR